MAGIVIGVIEEILDYNFTNPATVELVLFVLLLVVLLVRVSTLRKGGP